jgi:hypothetical protein
VDFFVPFAIKLAAAVKLLAIPIAGSSSCCSESVPDVDARCRAACCTAANVDANPPRPPSPEANCAEDATGSAEALIGMASSVRFTRVYPMLIAMIAAFDWNQCNRIATRRDSVVNREHPTKHRELQRLQALPMNNREEVEKANLPSRVAAGQSVTMPSATLAGAREFSSQQKQIVQFTLFPP